MLELKISRKYLNCFLSSAVVLVTSRPSPVHIQLCIIHLCILQTNICSVITHSIYKIFAGVHYSNCAVKNPVHLWKVLQNHFKAHSFILVSSHLRVMKAYTTGLRRNFLLQMLVLRWQTLSACKEGKNTNYKNQSSSMSNLACTFI